MKFYDRKKEMAILYAAKKQSQTSACFTVMTGRRRIGKTALLLESVKDTRFVYIFALRTISTCHSGNAWHSYLWRNQRVRTALWTADATFPKGKFHINHWRISRISLYQSVYRQWHTTYLGPISRDFQNQFHCMRFRLFNDEKNIRRPQGATIRTPYRPNCSASIHHHRYQRDSSRPCPQIHIGRFALLVFADRWSSQIHHPIDGSESI